MIKFLLNHTPLFYLTQSLWRDEAFSVWIAKDSLQDVIIRTSGDFNPPFYYILLHFYMKIFGTSVVVMRSMSFVFFILFLYFVYRFALKIFRSHKFSLFTTSTMALNPLLLYYAFELRMYSLLALLATASMYFLYIKSWVWYIVFTILGMYTQPFMIFVILAQFVYLLLNKKYKTVFVVSLFLFGLYLPWLPTLVRQFKQSGPMWIYPVNLNLVLSVLGNLFTGYEGTPGNLWFYMKILSGFIFAVSIWSWKKIKLRKILLLFYLWLFIPLGLVLGISFYKPIFVNRYLIYIGVVETFLLCVWVYQLQNHRFKQIVIMGLLSLGIVVNFWVSSFHQKVDIRSTFQKINLLLTSSDFVYAETPLVFYESLYYAPKTTQVFLYNPHRIQIPRYVGSDGMPESVWATTYPTFPQKAFVISEDGSYRINSLVTGN